MRREPSSDTAHAPRRPPIEPAPTSSRASAAGLFLLSAAILSLEVLQTRLFAYSLNSLLFYGAVGVALLGLGASGTALTIWQGWRRRPLGTVAAWASSGFSVTLVLAHALFARTAGGFSPTLSWGSLGSFALLALPYFFAGGAVTACLASAGPRVHAIYLVNLIGSAAGCFVVFLLLKPLGAPLLLGMIALLGVAAAALFGRAGGARAGLALAALVALGASVRPERVFPIPPDRTGQLSILVRLAERAAGGPIPAERLFEAWDPTGRIEIHRFGDLRARLPEPVPFLFYSQDAGAGSILLGVEGDLERARGFFERTLYGAAYAARGGGEGARILVIGLGGGPDILAALFFGAASVTGVEINQSAIDAIAGPLAGFVGDPYARPEVRIARIDGRTFARASRDAYDLVVLSGVDTKAVLAAGSLAISENHLYTVEAFDEYLDRLAEGGMIGLLRFGFSDRMRLAAIGVAALRARGVEHPERHFAVLEQKHWTTVLIGRDPIPEETIRRLEAWTRSVPGPDTGIRIPAYDVFDLGLEQPPRLLYPVRGPVPENDRDVAGFFASVAAGRDEAFLDRFDVNYAPTWDDRPFFFDVQRRDRLLVEMLPSYHQLFRFLGIAAVLAAVAIVLPVPFGRKGGAGGRGKLRALVYFSALGFGFITLEIGFAQKLVLFLGHPSHAVTVVLATLLVAAGLGSGFAGRFAGQGKRLVRRGAVPAIAASSLLLLLAVDLLGSRLASLPLEARIAAAALALAPLGFALGIPFPTGLASIDRRAPSLVPWGIAANGFTSVVGAAAALPAAMLFGHRALIATGLAFYLVAAAAFPSSNPATADA